MQYLFCRSRPQENGYVFVRYDFPPGQSPILARSNQKAHWPKPPPFETDQVPATPSASSPAPSSPSEAVVPLGWSSPSQQQPPNEREAALSDLTDRWLRRTGWPEMFRGYSRRWIRQSSQLPTKSAGLFPFDKEFQRPVRMKTLGEQIRPALSNEDTEEIYRMIARFLPQLYQTPSIQPGAATTTSSFSYSAGFRHSARILPSASSGRLTRRTDMCRSGHA